MFWVGTAVVQGTVYPSASWRGHIEKNHQLAAGSGHPHLRTILANEKKALDRTTRSENQDTQYGVRPAVLSHRQTRK
jgi:hypothetical protein